VTDSSATEERAPRMCAVERLHAWARAQYGVDPISIDHDVRRRVTYVVMPRGTSGLEHGCRYPFVDVCAGTQGAPYPTERAE
jgi:hypothetical protein